MDEHLLVEGATARLRHDLVHEDRRPLARWVVRHLRYADLAAADLWSRSREDAAPGRWSGRPGGRARWWYERAYLRAPLGVRALAYFAYRYVLRGGFLDGREGLIYHVLQALWYRARSTPGSSRHAGARPRRTDRIGRPSGPRRRRLAPRSVPGHRARPPRDGMPAGRSGECVSAQG